MKLRIASVLAVACLVACTFVDAQGIWNGEALLGAMPRPLSDILVWPGSFHPEEHHLQTRRHLQRRDLVRGGDAAGEIARGHRAAEQWKRRHPGGWDGDNISEWEAVRTPTY